MRRWIPWWTPPLASGCLPGVYRALLLQEGRITERRIAATELEHAEGIACVIGDPTFEASSRVRSLSPEHVKGLEFDLVVLIDPEAFGTGIEGAVDRYVAMTRATQQLVILKSSGGKSPVRNGA